MGISDSQIVHVRRGSLLHDIGKMGVPDAILLKPGPLPEERMGDHAPPSAAGLRPADPHRLPPAGARNPLCHHEKWDGTGYPRGLKGEQIPLAARIFAVADVWDALTSDRPYRQAWSSSKAMDYIRENSGAHFDPQVVEIFLKEIIKQDESE
jgi:HD-GYP domain-containing protein (c-di-GMP phosphodiesterase class II)